MTRMMRIITLSILTRAEKPAHTASSKHSRTTSKSQLQYNLLWKVWNLTMISKHQEIFFGSYLLLILLQIAILAVGAKESNAILKKVTEQGYKPRILLLVLRRYRHMKTNLRMISGITAPKDILETTETWRAWTCRILDTWRSSEDLEGSLENMMTYQRASNCFTQSPIVGKNPKCTSHR